MAAGACKAVATLSASPADEVNVTTSWARGAVATTTTACPMVGNVATSSDTRKKIALTFRVRGVGDMVPGGQGHRRLLPRGWAHCDGIRSARSGNLGALVVATATTTPP